MIKTSNTKMSAEYTLRASCKFDLESMSVSKPTLGLLSHMRSGFFRVPDELGITVLERLPSYGFSDAGPVLTVA